MKTILQKISVLLLCAILICSVLPSRAVAGYQIPGACQVQTEAGTAAVKTLDCDYDNNTYLSLRDTAMALNGTEKSDEGPADTEGAEAAGRDVTLGLA